MAGTRLWILPAENTTWGAWQQEHSKSLALSFVTGYERDYRVDPYADYPFPRNPGLLVSVRGVTKVYAFSELKKSSSPVVDQLGGRSITILFDRKSNTTRVQSDGEAISFVSFVNDLKAFYPEAEIYRGGRRRM